MRRREVGVEFERLHRRLLGLRHHLAGRAVIGVQDHVGLRQRRVEARGLRIPGYALLKVLDRPVSAFASALSQLVQTEQVLVVALRIQTGVDRGGSCDR